jgi:transcriptional regulator with XRE-family HTH domain
MGSREAADLYFGTRVRAARERRGWSQEELAKRLTDKGIPVYASTIAKIESEKKPRAARLGEAAGIADLFGVSLDSLLGRHTGLRSDLVFALRGLTDAARQSSAELTVIVSVLRRRLEDLAAFEFDGSDLVLAETIRAVNGLMEAVPALWEIAAFELPSGANVRLRGDLVERAATGKT